MNTQFNQDAFNDAVKLAIYSGNIERRRLEELELATKQREEAGKRAEEERQERRLQTLLKRLETEVPAAIGKAIANGENECKVGWMPSNYVEYYGDTSFDKLELEDRIQHLTDLGKRLFKKLENAGLFPYPAMGKEEVTDDLDPHPQDNDIYVGDEYFEIWINLLWSDSVTEATKKAVTPAQVDTNKIRTDGSWSINSKDANGDIWTGRQFPEQRPDFLRSIGID